MPAALTLSIPRDFTVRSPWSCSTEVVRSRYALADLASGHNDPSMEARGHADGGELAFESPPACPRAA